MQLSIITIHLDYFEGLRDTLVSLTRLLATNGVEWIVVDGGSHPRSSIEQELLLQVRGTAEVFISEPDQGIYHAMNKGTAQARGDYVLYLNAGDELHSAFDLGVLQGDLATQRPAMIWGTCHEKYPGGAVVKVKNRSPRLAWYGMPVNHQNVLFRRDLLGENPYDERYKLLADYDLVSRLLERHGDVHRTGVPIAIYKRGGTSAQCFAQTMKEEETLRCLHFGVSPAVSRGITHLKTLNHHLGRIPVVRRLMRKWV